MELPEKIQSVVDGFKSIPGVGHKSALRMTMNVLDKDDSFVDDFSNSLMKLRELHECEVCFAICDDLKCSICNDDKRNSNLICVVESFTDYLAIENSGTFRGLFHVLGGVLNPLMGKGPDQLKLDELVKRVQNNGVKNLILALNPSVEGDATCAYISDLFDDKVEIERIGFGIPIGGSLEYVDAMTIGKAFENKKSMR